MKNRINFKAFKKGEDFMGNGRSRSLFAVVACVAIMLQALCAGAATVSAIKPGVQWYDTAGNEIKALGGLVTYYNGTYYWVGSELEDKSGFGDFVATNLYSSTDLMNWTFRRAILTRSSHADLDNASLNTWCGRPSLFYSSANNRWVLYNEWQTSNMTAGDNDLGWATCSTVDGNYAWQGHFKPGGYPFHDSSVYSENEKNYFVTSNWDGGGADGAIWEIGADDKPGTLVTSWNLSGEIEGTHLFKRNGYYYWIGSEKAGWRGSQSKYIKATTMAGLKSAGGYTTLSYTGTDSATGYNSQCDFVLLIEGTGDYILCKDKWSQFYPSYGTGDQVWLPLQWNGDTPSVAWTDQWVPNTLVPSPTPAGVLGDVNGNGAIDISDALLVAQYYVGITPAVFIPANADVNRDGAITIVDALRIAQYYVGLIGGF